MKAFLIVFIVLSCPSLAQVNDSMPKMLLNDMQVQIDITEAVNNMYNFKFEAAEKEFKWFQYNYPDHPLPVFLLGLSTWWKMMTDLSNTSLDDRFIQHMEETIKKSKRWYKKSPENPEAAFFLAAAHGFLGRLYAERKSWLKSASMGKKALKYMRIGKGDEELSPEFLFGEALYNYYSKWIPENYPALKPILLFFKKGDKALGLSQLEEVAHNAFYTRTEAQCFLMKIYNNEEGGENKAFDIAAYLHTTYPDNAYFHRYYAMMSFVKGRFVLLENLSKDILLRYEAQLLGYEEVSARYAAYYMAYIYLNQYKNEDKAKEYFLKVIAYTEKNESYDSGYYLSSLLKMARLEDQKGNIKEAKSYYTRIKKYADKNSKMKKEARQYLRKNRTYK